MMREEIIRKLGLISGIIILKRMLKKGLIRANKVGGQYRILGKEILRIVSPTIEKRAEKQYVMLKKRIIKVINKW